MTHQTEGEENKEFDVSGGGDKYLPCPITNLFKYDSDHINDCYYNWGENQPTDRDSWIKFDFGERKINLTSYNQIEFRRYKSQCASKNLYDFRFRWRWALGSHQRADKQPRTERSIQTASIWVWQQEQILQVHPIQTVWLMGWWQRLSICSLSFMHWIFWINFIASEMIQLILIKVNLIIPNFCIY